MKCSKGTIGMIVFEIARRCFYLSRVRWNMGAMRFLIVIGHRCVMGEDARADMVEGRPSIEDERSSVKEFLKRGEGYKACGTWIGWRKMCFPKRSHVGKYIGNHHIKNSGRNLIYETDCSYVNFTP